MANFVWTIHLKNGSRIFCTVREAKRFASNSFLGKKIDFVQFNAT